MDPISALFNEHIPDSAATSAAVQAPQDSAPQAGALLIAGCVEFDAMAGKPEGLESHVVIDVGEPVVKSFSSSSAMHLFILTTSGKLYAMGSNSNGQLGLNDLQTRAEPTIVNIPFTENIVKVACGRHHSLILVSNGDVYGCGRNACGQVGLGDGKAVSGDVKAFTKLPLKNIRDIDAGLEHSIACNFDGKVFTWGSPQYGQLGFGSTGEYLKEGGKGKALRYAYVTSPRQVTKFIVKDSKGKVSEDIDPDSLKFAIVRAGKNHSICVEDWSSSSSQNRCFCWGTGGYGRLGHNSPDDELYPRELTFFSPNVVQGSFKLNPQRQVRQVVAGSTYTLAVTLSEHVYFWGKLSNSSRGESTMYPKLVEDLYNWKTKLISGGNNLVIVKADEKFVGWGAPVAGMIGFEGNVKSTIGPKFITALDGYRVSDISAGYGHVCFIVEPSSEVQGKKMTSLSKISKATIEDTSGKKRSSSTKEGESAASKKSKSKR